MNDEEDKVYSIEIVVEELAHLPHTYDSILGNENNPTRKFILRRKLNNLCKQGIIYKSNIPGTRFGKCIFYGTKKKYYILVEANRTGSEVYYFEHFKKIDKLHIRVKQCFYLDNNIWTKKYNKLFNEGKILLFL